MEKRPKITTEMHFAQLLASNQKKVRDKALKKVGEWFESASYAKDAFTNESMLTLWKGIFYYFWNLDKAVVQQEVAVTISRFIHNFKTENDAFLYADTFLQTMAREWFGIDRFRIEKFMLFVRKFFTEIFVLMKSKEWNIRAIKKFRKMLKKTVASADAAACPLELKLHVIDIYMDELAQQSANKFTPKLTRAFLLPYCNLLVCSHEITLLESVQKEIFLYLLNQEVDEDVFGEFPILPFDQIAIAKMLKKWSKKQDVRSQNRRIIKEIIQTFENTDLDDVSEMPEQKMKSGGAIKRSMVERAAEEMFEDDLNFREQKATWIKEKKKK